MIFAGSPQPWVFDLGERSRAWKIGGGCSPATVAPALHPQSLSTQFETQLPVAPCCFFHTYHLLAYLSLSDFICCLIVDDSSFSKLSSCFCCSPPSWDSDLRRINSQQFALLKSNFHTKPPAGISFSAVRSESKYVFFKFISNLKTMIKLALISLRTILV